MPREPRYHVPGDLYHVMSRGNHRDIVFRTDDDFRHYLSLIQRYALRYKACVHAYALMSNHVHMLVQEGEYPLGRFMQGVQQSYTQYFNTRYGQTGHLFQGRYKANRIDGDEYLLALVRYIHLNPVKTGIVTDPADYQWSSHRHYYLDTDRYGIETGLIRGLMAQYGGRDIADYELLAEKPIRSGVTNVPGVTIPGSKIRQGEANTDTGDLEQVADQVSQFTYVLREQLLGRRKDRATSLARWLFIYVAVQRGYSLTAISQYLQRSVSSVAMALQAVEDDLRAGGVWGQRIRSFGITE